MNELGGPAWMRFLGRLVGLLPSRSLRWLGALTGWLAGSVLRIRRSHVVGAMRRAGIEDAPRVASGMYRSLGIGLFELLWMAGRPLEVPSEFVFSRRAEELLLRVLERERGLMVATAHTGNWDFSACAIASLMRERSAKKLHVVTKRLTWGALDRMWQRLRAMRGVELCDARGATKRVVSALARGDVVAMMIDQVPERRSGVMVHPFLGAEARHDLAPVLLATRAEAPIVVAFGRRRACGAHEIDVVDYIDLDALRAPGASHAVMQRISSALERFILEHPTQWLWMHRRWKKREEDRR